MSTMGELPRAVGVAMTLALGAGAMGQTCGQQWLAGEGVPGLNSSVLASVTWDPDGKGPQTPKLVVAGGFTLAGTTPANRIAMFDPETGEWSTLGSGFNGFVMALAVMPDGSLVAGGSFTGADDQTSRRVARWDGESWSPLGEGFNETVFALTVRPTGELVAAGTFTQSGPTSLNRIASWDGAAWQPLGTGMEGEPDFVGINALSSLANGDLVAGGQFTGAGGQTANNIARWNGSWHAMGSGLNTAVRTFTHWDSDGAGPLPERLIAGGEFSTRVAMWTGASWTNLPGLGSVNTLGTTAAGQLVAGGGSGGGLHMRVGSTWQLIGGGTNGNAISLTALPDGRLFVGGGGFSLLGGTLPTANFGILDGAAWSTTGSGFDSQVVTLASTTDGGLIAGGWFTSVADREYTNMVARWDGARWSPLGTGAYTTSASVSKVLAMSDGEVIATGSFPRIGGVSALNIARWNGTTWAPMGSGLAGGHINAMAELPSGDLVVGGSFPAIGGVPAVNIAVWNGAAWSSLGASAEQIVRDLVVTPSGELLTVNDTPSSSSVMWVRRWNGAAWENFGEEFARTSVHQFGAIATTADGAIIVGGNFNFAGGVPVRNIAVWNGLHWAALGEGLADRVADITVLRDGSIVAMTGPLPAGRNRVWRWNGSTWDELETTGAMYRGPMALAPTADGLAVGGDFTGAGGKVSAYFARWSLTGTLRVAEDPVDTTVPVGVTIELSATPESGFEGVSVQWMRNGQPISNGPGGASPDGGLVSGAAGPLESPTQGTPAMLIVEQSTAGDAGEYRAVFSNSCGEAVTAAALVVVDIGDCATDFNNDSVVNSTDVSDFINAWFTDQAKGTVVADWNNDGVVNSTDVSDFINDWFFDTLQGCGG